MIAVATAVVVAAATIAVATIEEVMMIAVAAAAEVATEVVSFASVRVQLGHTQREWMGTRQGLLACGTLFYMRVIG
jgi:hypothetical protein